MYRGRFSYFEWEGGGGIVHVTVNYSTNMKREGSGPYITVLIPILGMGGGSRPYITVLIPILGMGGGSIPYITVLLPILGMGGGSRP